MEPHGVVVFVWVEVVERQTRSWRNDDAGEIGPWCDWSEVDGSISA